MRYGKLLLCVVPLLALGACSDDDGIVNQGPPPAMASVRFINAVVDTGTVDLTFVDRVENLPTLKGVAPRATSGFYQGTAPGARPARVFPSSNDIKLTQVRLVDETINLVANTRYPHVYAGRAAAGAAADQRHRLAVIQDPDRNSLPSPAGGSIGVQALHVAVGMGNVDVHVVPVDSASVATPADWQAKRVGTLSNVGYLGKAGAYITVPARNNPRATATDKQLYRFVVTKAGTAEVIFASTPNEPGAVATASAGARPGVQISGSVMTVVIAPGTTAGTRQSAAANQTPAAVLIADKLLNQ
jgi:hypothetical protein